MTPYLRIRTVVVLALAVASCSDVGPTPVEPTAIPDPHGLGPSYSLVGTTLGLVQGIVETAIGPDGGVLEIGDGHTLTFPAGAVSDSVVIRAEQDATTVQVTFAPHGLVFPADARPTLSFRYTAGTNLTDADAPDLTIIYLNELGELEEVLGGEVDTAADVIRTPIDHFSTYVMATD